MLLICACGCLRGVAVAMELNPKGGTSRVGRSPPGGLGPKGFLRVHIGESRPRTRGQESRPRSPGGVPSGVHRGIQHPSGVLSIECPSGAHRVSIGCPIGYPSGVQRVSIGSPAIFNRSSRTKHRPKRSKMSNKDYPKTDKPDAEFKSRGQEWN